MPNLLIRDLDPDILEKLKRAAAEHGRSLQAEIHEILRQASMRNMAETRRISDYWLKYFAGRTFSDSTQLIREDRDSR